MNQISKRQNENDILEALVAQKYLYSLSKFINVICYIISIILIFIGFVTTDKLNEIVIIGVVLGEVVNALLEIYRNNIIRDAAEIQEYIDYTLFGFKFKNNKISKYTVDEIKRKIIKINVNHKKYSDIQKNNNGESKIKGVKDWYTNIDENLSTNLAISECQKQNTYFDYSLLKIYKYLNYLVVIIWIFISFGLFYKKEYPIVWALIPLITKIVLNLRALGKLDEAVFAIKILEDQRNNKGQKELLLEIQEKIFNRRKCTLIIPDWLYKLKSLKLHLIYRGGK